MIKTRNAIEHHAPLGYITAPPQACVLARQRGKPSRQRRTLATHHAQLDWAMLV